MTFEEMYTSYYGEKLDKIEQLSAIQFTGEELKAFVEHCIQQKLNIDSVSGKRPDLEYLVSIKQKNLDLYDKMKKPSSIYQEGYRDGFIDGADDIIEAACDIGAVGTVSARLICNHKTIVWSGTTNGTGLCLECNDFVRKSSEGQP